MPRRDDDISIYVVMIHEIEPVPMYSWAGRAFFVLVTNSVGDALALTSARPSRRDSCLFRACVTPS